MEKPLFRRRVTTGVALFLISIGTLGIFLSSLNFLAIYSGAAYKGPLFNMADAWTAGALAMLPKLGLLVLGIALLRRSSKSMFFLMTTFFLSVADSLHQFFVTLPPQLAQVSQGGAKFGFVVGAYTLTFFAVVLYVSVFFFLRNRTTRLELGALDVSSELDPELQITG